VETSNHKKNGAKLKSHMSKKKKSIEMTTTIMTHEVKNFTEWKKVFDAGEPLRQHSGVTINGVYRSVDNPNHITIIMESPDSRVVQGFLTNPDLSAAMAEAGVLGVPQAKILEKV
jgi:hypothetical protein